MSIMQIGNYKEKQLPPRQRSVETLEIVDIHSGSTLEIPIINLTSEEELNSLLHELWPDFFPLS
jgi:hypothetical protein